MNKTYSIIFDVSDLSDIFITNIWRSLFSSNLIFAIIKKFDYMYGYSSDFLVNTIFNAFSDIQDYI